MLFNFKFKPFTVVLLLLATCTFAQTGIGTSTPHASAKLDVTSTNKGFLPPRVNLTSYTDTTTIPNPAEGLLVYCTGTGNLASGYYFWNGNAWATIATAGGSGSFAASFLRGSRTATQSLAVDGIVSFSTVNNTAGQDISLNTTNGKITLVPGNTYRLIAAIPNFSGGQRPAFMWYNETTSSYIGSAFSTYNPGDNASLAASGGIAQVIITPSVTTVLSFRMLSSLSSGSVTVGGNADFSTTGSYPWFEVQVISGNAPVTNEKLASGFVGRGQDITLGNLKVRFAATGNMSLQVSTVSGTYSVYGSHVLFSGSLGGNTANMSVSTTPAYLNSGNNFLGAGDTGVWTIMDTTAKMCWRISMIIGSGYANNFISIERLF
jgi:hypothetical protein